jgi:hypothetical protein
MARALFSVKRNRRRKAATRGAGSDLTHFFSGVRVALSGLAAVLRFT